MIRNKIRMPGKKSSSRNRVVQMFALLFAGIGLLFLSACGETPSSNADSSGQSQCPPECGDDSEGDGAGTATDAYAGTGSVAEEPLEDVSVESPSDVPFTASISHFAMNAPVAPNDTWRRGSTFGQCGKRCETPHRMYTALKQSQVLVGWTSHLDWQEHPNPEWSICWDITRGHLSTFNISDTNALSHEHTVDLDYCDEIGEIHVSEDESITSVLCVTSRPEELPVLTNDATKNDEGECYQWYCNDHEGRDSSMVLLEWVDHKPVSRTPDVAVIVMQSIGGWNYGHFELDMTTDKSKYFISLKNTRGGHEAMESLFLRRSDWKRDFNAGGCAHGHVQMNLVVNNHEEGVFGAYCKGDGDITFRTYTSNPEDYENDSPNKSEVTIVRDCPEGSTKPNDYIASCRSNTMVSLGSRGFVGVAMGGGIDPTGAGEHWDYPEVGVVHLPARSNDFDASTHQYKWLNLPDFGIENGPSNRKGFPNIQHIGEGGESGTRFLLGWAPLIEDGGYRGGGYAREYALAVLDSDFNIVGEALKMPKNGTRWAEMDEWRVRDNGCVVWAYTWIDDDTYTYGADRHERGEAGQCVGDELSDRLSITVVCPR